MGCIMTTEPRDSRCVHARNLLEDTVPGLRVDPAGAISGATELGVVEHDELIVGGDVDVLDDCQLPTRNILA